MLALPFGLDQFTFEAPTLIEFHQASTHFPIGLLISALFFDVLGAIFKKNSLQTTSFWVQMLGTLALFVTLAAGYFGNPFAGKANSMGQMADVHAHFAYWTSGIFGILAIWRLKRAQNWKNLERNGFCALFLLAVALISLTGYLGAHMG